MIDFNFEDVNFQLPEQQTLVDWISFAVKNEGYELKNITYVFCSDEYLWNMNKQFLQHDYYTDIITFDYVKGKVVSGDLFISYDRIVDNANKFDVSRETELLRVMIHGVLHLIGYDDVTDELEAEIHKMEDYYLDIYNKEFRR
ncbi:MAG: rRNA maturation RNase YbeY [Bacteroidales bacterium]|jgi:rRNA maturation RNase YbeY|nr:rRNA maturation RNase YbeY [Bacteroidales bacterium]